MTSPAQIEAALFALPPAEREELPEALWQRHANEMGYVPHLTPEQIETLNRRAGEVERGEVELYTIEETQAGLSEAIRRVGAGEDPDAVLAELRARRDGGRSAERELAGVA